MPLQTARQVSALDVKPGWWLTGVNGIRCTARRPPRLGDAGLQARRDRLFAIQALTCGETPEGQTLLARAIDELPDDPTLLLLQEQIRPASTLTLVGAGILAQQIEESNSLGDRETTIAWLERAAPYLTAPSEYDYRSLYWSMCYVSRGLGRLDESLAGLPETCGGESE